MEIVVGIDIGGSTTKIAGFDKEKMLNRLLIKNSPAGLFFKNVLQLIISFPLCRPRA